MHKSVQITLIIVVGIVIIVAGMGFPNSSSTITANGQAFIDVVPDLLSVYMDIETKANTNEGAKEAHDEIYNELVTALLTQGLTKEEIQTQNFNIRPNYEYNYGGRTQNGYIASHSIKIELSTDDMNLASKVLDASIGAGVGVSYINFELSQELQNEKKSEAIKLASEDAKLKAQAMALGLDKKVGKLVSISDSNFGYSPWMAYGDMEVGTAKSGEDVISEIQPSEQTIYSNVQAVFKIK